tara:strand:+ start:101 stop:724 length:624 start_codon:yes stop_codon:yes gene_type:complete
LLRHTDSQRDSASIVNLKGETMGYNAYELRLQLFEKAKEFVWEKYNRDVLEWDRISSNRSEIKEKYYEDKWRYDSLKEQDKLGSLEYPVYPTMPELPEYPQYPTKKELLDMALFMRAFVDKQGDDTTDLYQFINEELDTNPIQRGLRRYQKDIVEGNPDLQFSSAKAKNAKMKPLIQSRLDNIKYKDAIKDMEKTAKKLESEEGHEI